MKTSTPNQPKAPPTDITNTNLGYPTKIEQKVDPNPDQMPTLKIQTIPTTSEPTSPYLIFPDNTLA